MMAGDEVGQEFLFCGRQSSKGSIMPACLSSLIHAKEDSEFHSSDVISSITKHRNEVFTVPDTIHTCDFDSPYLCDYVAAAALQLLFKLMDRTKCFGSLVHASSAAAASSAAS